MKGSHTGFAFFIAVPAAAFFSFSACVRGVDDAKQDARTFQEQVEAVAGSAIPGLVIAVREADGRVLVSAVGTADLESGAPMRAESRFYIGTISQSMLAAVILKLEEEGKIGMADPISNFLEFPGGHSVTIEMLLDHSSGFADWTGADLATTGNPRMPGLLKVPQTFDSLLAVAATDPPEFAPGEKQVASYTNFLLLAGLIEKVEGKPASEVLRERIFEPAGMEDTRYLKPGEKLDSLARGYRAEDGWGGDARSGLTEVGWADENLRGLPEMGIVSTARDLLKYHVALRTGRLVSAESFKRMHTVRPGKVNGLGYQISQGPRGRWEGNNGHAVGHLCLTYFHVEKGFYIAVMGNLGDTGLPVVELYDLRYGEPPSK